MFAEEFDAVKDRVLFGKEVVKVDAGDGGAPGDCKVRVECRDGTAFQADHVLCTVSLGYLKANQKYALGYFIHDVRTEAARGWPKQRLGDIDCN